MSAAWMSGQAAIGAVSLSGAQVPKVTMRACVRPAIASTRGSSALSTASPSAGSAATSSPFSRAMASSEPKVSRCAGSTVVTTAICGGAIAAEAGDLARCDRRPSPAPRALLRQQLAQRDGQAVEAVVVGAVLEDRPSAASTAAIASLVVVLPTLPVTPMTSTCCFGEDVARPVLDRLPRVGHDDAGDGERARLGGRSAQHAGRAARGTRGGCSRARRRARS